MEKRTQLLKSASQTSFALNSIITEKNSPVKLTFEKKYTLPGGDAQILSMAFSKTEPVLAVAPFGGDLHLLNKTTFKHLKKLENEQQPVTCLKWKPNSREILLAVYSNGSIVHWHSSSGKMLSSMVEEGENAIMTVDYESSGEKFATAGEDKVVRLYDDNMKLEIGKMKGNGMELPGHSNRIFCVKFHPDFPNILMSGGWDNTVQVYDVRSGSVENQFFGPHVCGESIDFNGMEILVGSGTTDRQLTLWDLRNYSKTKEILLDSSGSFKTYCYTAKYSRRGTEIGMGGSDLNTFRLFGGSEHDLCGSTKTLNKPCYAIDFDFDDKHVAFGSADGVVRLCRMDREV